MRKTNVRKYYRGNIKYFKKKAIAFTSAVLVILTLIPALSGCSLSLDSPDFGLGSAVKYSGSTSQSTFRYTQNSDGVWDGGNSPLDGAPIIENKAVYVNDRDDEVICLYLTVKKGVEGSGSNRVEYTFDELITYSGNSISGIGSSSGSSGTGPIAGDNGGAAGLSQAVSEPFCEVIFQEGSEKGKPSAGFFGFGETNVNARIEARGDLSNAEPRSFRIRLYARAGLWRGVTVINLNKQLNDLSRMKNKLGFDAIEMLGNIAGLRTSFVRLYIKDLTGSVHDSAFTDYGIYTYMEQPNKEYLRSRGLNAEGNLYRARDFNFSRYPEIIRDFDDPVYNKAVFEEILDIREGRDHKALIDMLDLLNDPSIDFSNLSGKYFNRENIVAYCALSVLYGNNAAAYDDYMIYRPNDSATWYLIPYNMNNIFEEGAGERKNSPPESASGITVLMGNVLLRKFLAAEGSIDALTAEIDRMYRLIGPEFVNRQTDTYRKTILKIMFSMPELAMLPKSAEYAVPYVESFPGLVKDNYDDYLDFLNRPYPPYITSCRRTGAGVAGSDASSSTGNSSISSAVGNTGSSTGNVTDNGGVSDDGGEGILIEWETGWPEGYVDENNVKKKDIKYDVLIAYDTDFENIITTIKQVDGNRAFLRGAIEGTCYVRVVAVESSSGSEDTIQTSNCANVFTDEFGDRHYGVWRLD